MKLCSIEKCERPFLAKGFCLPHYKKFKRHGDPLGGRISYDSCSVEECSNDIIAKGLCHKHYQRNKNGLNLTDKTVVEMDAKERIKSNIKLNKITGCWEWQGATVGNGYGLVTFNYKATRVHRLSYQAFVGEIKDGLYVLHKCDRPICCNPKHLFLGTQKENIEDMMKKCRGRK